MDAIDRKLLLVFDNDVFKGLLSIGDIQRAIIKNIPLDQAISSVMRSNIRVATIDDDREEIRKNMFEYRTECMPIINQDGSIHDVLFWEEEFSENQLVPDGGLEGVPVVIMAGGLGSRLKPLTNVIPKPLVPVGDKPIIEIIVNRFNRLGVKDFYFSVNYKKEMIEYYFDHIQSKKYQVQYFTEDKPLGTAGSIYLLKKVLKVPFFVSNCDILIEQDYREIYNYHIENSNTITLVGSLKHVRIPYGTIEIGEGGILKEMKEKPEITYMINSGMYVLDPLVLEFIPDNTFMHITELIEIVKNKKEFKVGVFPVSEKAWFDIGDWEEYRQTIAYFEKKSIS
ncbi:MAG: nucleotidyltransferase family protein [Bacteroidetes bacterium]|nr:nucleotidyltransferase family protein [Bacteroidota bacterium]